MEPEITTSGETLAASPYEVATFKLGEVNTDFKQENRKKNLNHCNIRCSLNVKQVRFVRKVVYD